MRKLKKGELAYLYLKNKLKEKKEIISFLKKHSGSFKKNELHNFLSNLSGSKNEMSLQERERIAFALVKKEFFEDGLVINMELRKKTIQLAQELRVSRSAINRFFKTLAGELLNEIL